MRNVHIPGAQRDVGKTQGFEGISVLYTTEGALGRDVPVWKVAYQLTRDEARRLIEGGNLVLTVVGSPPISPHRLEVQPT